MQRMSRIIALVLVINLVLAGLLVYLVNNNPEQQTDVVVFTEYQPTDISAIQVVNSAGGFEVSMQGAGYLFDDIGADLLDLDRFYALLVRSSTVSALKRVAEKVDNLADYGLSEPQAEVAVDYADGTNLNFAIGAEETVSGHYYMQVEGEDDVYLLAADSANYYLHDKRSYIDHFVTPQLPENVSALTAIQDIRFSGGELAEPVIIQAVSVGDEEEELAALSFGAISHLVHGRGTYELDQTYGTQVLGSILGIEAREVVDYGLSEEAIADMGFAAPYMTVEFDLKEGDTVTPQLLSLLKEDEDRYLAHLSGSGAVFEIGRPLFVDLEYEKLMLRWFLSPLILDLSGLTIETPEASYAFAIVRDEEQNETVTLNGEAVDLELFRQLYRLVTSASAADGAYYLDAQVSGQPLVSISYQYLNADKPDDVLSLYPGETRRHFVEVNGVVEFDIRESFLAYLITACEQIEQGESFDINW